MTKEIKLTREKFAIVDDEDYERLNQWKWHCTTRGYAMRTEHLDKDNKRGILMHRFIIGAVKGEEVDHINRDTLDNRRINLRLCTRIENSHNIAKLALCRAKSKYKGVSLNIGNNKWEVKISNNKQKIFVGYFTDELAAANAYNYYAKEYFGEFVYLNEVEIVDNWLDYRVNLEKTSEYYSVQKRGENSWTAIIRVNGKQINLGTYNNENAAANCYNYWSNHYFGKEGIQNKVENISNWEDYKTIRKQTYVGVYWDKSMKKWGIKIKKRGTENEYFNKYYTNELAAAHAYNYYRKLIGDEKTIKKLNENLEPLENWLDYEHVSKKIKNKKESV